MEIILRAIFLVLAVVCLLMVFGFVSDDLVVFFFPALLIVVLGNHLLGKKK